MFVVGRVEKVRRSGYTSQKSKQYVAMVYLDVYDKTAGLVSCEMQYQDGMFVPEEEAKIVATVRYVKKVQFGSGFSLVLEKVEAAPVEAHVPVSVSQPTSAAVLPPGRPK